LENDESQELLGVSKVDSKMLDVNFEIEVYSWLDVRANHTVPSDEVSGSADVSETDESVSINDVSCLWKLSGLKCVFNMDDTPNDDGNPLLDNVSYSDPDPVEAAKLRNSEFAADIFVLADFIRDWEFQSPADVEVKACVTVDCDSIDSIPELMYIAWDDNDPI
jgi:hypothetical protein